MLDAIWILATAFIVVLIEKNHLKNSWKRKEKVTFFVLLLFGTFVSIAWVLGVKLSNPLEVIADVYRPVSVPLSLYLRQFQ